jgi:hypothetical protein
LPILQEVGDGIKGERIVCEYAGPRRLTPKRIPQKSGHRQWRIKLESALCVIEKKFRWLG